MEHGHDGLWNSMGYNTREAVSIDMKACYPASFHRRAKLHPISSGSGAQPTAWHASASTGPCLWTSGLALPRSTAGSSRKASTQLSWPGSEATFRRRTGHPWRFALSWLRSASLRASRSPRLLSPLRNGPRLLEDHNQGCIIIKKFTQGGKADRKRLTRRLLTHGGNFLVLWEGDLYLHHLGILELPAGRLPRGPGIASEPPSRLGHYGWCSRGCQTSGILVPNLSFQLWLGHHVKLQADVLDRVGSGSITGCLDHTAVVIEGEFVLHSLSKHWLEEWCVSFQQLKVQWDVEPFAISISDSFVLGLCLILIPRTHPDLGDISVIWQVNPWYWAFSLYRSVFQRSW